MEIEGEKSQERNRKNRDQARYHGKANRQCDIRLCRKGVSVRSYAARAGADGRMVATLISGENAEEVIALGPDNRKAVGVMRQFGKGSSRQLYSPGVG